MASRRKYLPVGLASASLPQTLALHHSLPLAPSGASAMTLSHTKLGLHTDAAPGE
ncbi:hypothetical protein JCM19231_1566 [Vibrio ishigakensis]|uniref:Uncharacterized protein n=1 Tax=Vibrio ishigakensis TaxID=1481914 RepID=A0A0B8P5X6_9VIBR|nr:hypothetical protein JCM19231_1566 [Vibrio ishigakensis]